jgi:hypothetical protein
MLSLIVLATSMASSPVAGAAPLRTAGNENCPDGWRSVDLPSTTAFTFANDIAVVAGAPAWIAGAHAGAGIPRRPMMLKWMGAGWKEVAVARVPADSGFQAVDAAGPKQAWAVGFSAFGRLLRPMSEHWNGNGWTRVSLPSHYSSSPLTDVTELRPDLAWAVGYRMMGGRPAPFAVEWSSGTWIERDPPSAIVRSGALLAVADSGPDNVWAVGYERQPGHVRRPIALRWNGSTWSRAEIEGLPAGEVILTNVAMRSAMDGWAVGYARDSHGHLPMAVHWDGSAWRPSPIPWPDGLSGALFGTALEPNGSVVVVGAIVSSDVASVPRSLIGRHTQGGWQLWSPPDDLRIWTLLHGAGAAKDATWVVGWGSGASRALTSCTPAAESLPLSESADNPPQASDEPGQDLESGPSAQERATRSSLAAPVPAESLRFTARDVARDVGIYESTFTYGATAADFNNDLWPDLLISRHTERPRLVFGGPHGFHAASGVTLHASDRHGCAAADVDRDGFLDIFCAIGAARGTSTKRNELWLHPGTGSTLEASAAFGISDPFGRGRRAAFLSRDEDRYPDLFVTSDPLRVDGIPSPNRLYVNDRGGVFRAAPGARMDLDIGGVCARSFDLDRDGADELLLCSDEPSGQGTGLHVFGNLDGAFHDITAALGLHPIYDRDALAADMDGDGRSDIVQLSYQLLRVSLQRGGSMSTSYERVIPGGVAAAAGDANGDGDTDLYVVTGGTSNGDDLLLINTDHGRSFTSVAIPQTGRGSAEGVTTIDHDRNGLDDFLVLNGGYVPGPIQLIAFYRT